MTSYHVHIPASAPDILLTGKRFFMSIDKERYCLRIMGQGHNPDGSKLLRLRCAENEHVTTVMIKQFLHPEAYILKTFSKGKVGGVVNQ